MLEIYYKQVNVDFIKKSIDNGDELMFYVSKEIYEKEHHLLVNGMYKEFKVVIFC